MVLEQIANLSLGVIRVLSSSLSRSASFYASETWKSERFYKPFSARLAFLRGFDPLRWYHFLLCACSSMVRAANS